VCNFSWQNIKHAQSWLEVLIKPDVSFQDGQDTYCILPGYDDTVQSDMMFRNNILSPFSVFNTDVCLLLRLTVDHCINVVREQLCSSTGNGSLWDLGRKIKENSIIRQSVIITVQTLHELLISSIRVL
jgi:hypothetical protein